MRLFYALTFDRPSRTKLHHLATTLAPTPAMGRPVEGDQLHLTLLFLGEVDHEAAETLKTMLSLLPPLPTRYLPASWRQHPLGRRRAGRPPQKGQPDLGGVDTGPGPLG